MPGNHMKHEIFGFDAPTDPDRWVYHYTSLSSALAIAGSETFRFNSLANMNDPREFKDLVLPVMSSGQQLTDTDRYNPEVGQSAASCGARRCLHSRRRCW